jgi:hypothetical protein
VKIESLEDLRKHLQKAIQIEHSTIPPYLCAYYSIENSLTAAAQSIRGIAIEEMLHLSLAGNILNAVNGQPDFNDPLFIPKYPSPMLDHADPPIVIHLGPASVATIRGTFLAIEQPETAGDVPEDDNYTTLGQFYDAVSRGIDHLVHKLGEKAVFGGDPARQLGDGYTGGYAATGGRLFPVTDLRSARRAIDEIVSQGEGSGATESDADGELAHYWRFNQIVNGTFPLGKVYPMRTDPRTDDLPAGPLRELSQLFDDVYGLLLRSMTRFFNMRSGPERTQLVATVAPLMYGVLRTIAVILMETRIPDREQTAGPSFQFSQAPQPEVVARCAKLRAVYPRLTGAYDFLLTLPPIDGAGDPAPQPAATAQGGGR